MVKREYLSVARELPRLSRKAKPMFLTMLFLDIFAKAAMKHYLAIHSQCLRDVDAHIRRVVRRNLDDLTNPRRLSLAISEFEKFVGRMVKASKRRGGKALGEDTFAEAKQQCGLIFWCKI
jgi:hypothetical protein